MKNTIILSSIKVDVDIKSSEPACMLCLPPAPMNDHLSLNGILIHSRIDCPKDAFYALNEEGFLLSPNEQPSPAKSKEGNE